MGNLFQLVQSHFFLSLFFMQSRLPRVCRREAYKKTRCQEGKRLFGGFSLLRYLSFLNICVEKVLRLSSAPNKLLKHDIRN